MDATRETIAAHGWQPWTNDREGEQLPSTQDWEEILVAIRLDWKTRFLRKPELVDGINEMSPAAYRHLGTSLSSADVILGELRQVVSAALARVLVAGAASTAPEPSAEEA